MTNVSRREFLEKSMFATAATTLAGSASTRCFAQGDAPKGEKLRVAVVGIKGRGGAHLAGFGERDDCQIVALVDVDETVLNNRADEIEKKTGHRPAVFSDMRKCFEDKSIDIVSIATPNHWHSLAAIWAIQAGKDVYVEKPVSHNVSEGRRVVEAARKYGRIVQTGTQSRSNPGMREAIDFIHRGGIGEVKLARGLCYKPRGSIGPKGNYDIPASVDYDLWSGPAEIKPLDRKSLHYDWHWMWDYGNGDLGNQGIHQMDIARWGLGEANIGNSVLSYGGRLGYEDAGETANTQVSIHEFANGKRLVFEVRGLKTEKYGYPYEEGGEKKMTDASVGVIFYGTEGIMVVPSYNGGVVLNLEGKPTGIKFQGGNDRFHFANFIDAVRSRKHEDLNADIEEGHFSSAMCHVGNISYRLGSPHTVKELAGQLSGDSEALETLDRFRQHLIDNKIDTETTKITVGPRLSITPEETFTGPHADEANKMLTREYRSPYIVPRTEDL
ncbi:Gfo/Idh/MocA family protein [Schlesneria sp.]|uniref:Gfo/Idh/MocA family protein n=1 Tax=Schlesneria sp. TaxID=2762018 RepID=UPI002F1ED169